MFAQHEANPYVKSSYNYSNPALRGSEGIQPTSLGAREGRAKSRTEPMNGYSGEGGSTIETLFGGLFCFLLFVLIIFCIAYPFTMYRNNPGLSYSDDNWWCYHCMASNCASRCWYGY